jgi:hypothetical protein
MDHKQQQSLNEAIMQQVFGSPPSSTIDESKMAELHSLIQDGKTAQQISKIMNIALSTVKMLMKDFNKEEALSPSSTIDEDNTAAVAKQVKKAVKEYTSGKLVVRSKGGKSRFIMVRADKIDNKLREMMADVMYPKANIHNKDDISYGNISSMIISAGVDAWIEALGLKEEEAAVSSSSSSLDEKSFRDFTTPASPELKKWIESGKVKILDSGVSDLGPTTKFVVVKNPKWFGGDRQDDAQVLMFTISDPERGRIKMFAFHGSHISLAKAMKFATNNKLVVKESVCFELDEAFDMKKMLKIFNKLKKNDTIKIKYDSSISKGKEFQTFVVTSPKRPVGKKGVERVIMKHVDNPTGVKYTLYNRDGSVSLAIGDMAASMTDIKESVEHSLDESLVLASDNLNAVKKTAEKLSKQSPDLTYYVVKHNERYMKGIQYAYYEVYQSVDMHLVRGKAKKIAGYGAKVDMRESVLEELDEANHDQRAADKSLFNAMKVVDPKAKWKMVKTDPSRFGDDVEITSQKMAEYGDWTLMAWSDGKLMHVWYDHPNGEGSVPEKDFKRVAKDMMSESVLVDEVTSIASSVESRKKVTKVLKKKGIGFHTSKGNIMVNPKNLIAAKSALNKEFAGDFETNSGMKLKATKKADISDEVEHLDENGHTAKEIMSKGKKLGDWVGKSYYEYEGNVWMVYGDDVVNKGSVDQAKKTLNKILLKNLKF